MKVYNVFFCSNYGNLDFWGCFSTELLAIDRISSHILQEFQFRSETFEDLKKELNFKSTKEKVKILENQASMFLEHMQTATSIDDIVNGIKKVENFTKFSYTPFVYNKIDEQILYHRFQYIFGEKYDKYKFEIVETELNEEIDKNIIN